MSQADRNTISWWRWTCFGLGSFLMLASGVFFLIASVDTSNPLWLVVFGVISWALMAVVMWWQRRRVWVTVPLPLLWAVGISIVAIKACAAGVLVAVECH